MLGCSHGPIRPLEADRQGAATAASGAPTNQAATIRIIQAVAVGIFMATGFSIIAFLSGTWQPRPTGGPSLAVIILSYYSAGIVGGGLVGFVLRFGDRWRTRIAASLIGWFTLYFCVVVAKYGSVLNWDSGRWQLLIALSVLSGGFFAFITRNDFRD